MYHRELYKKFEQFEVNKYKILKKCLGMRIENICN